MAKPIDRLVHELTKLPGVGEKTAVRFAFHVLRQESNFARDLAQALVDVKEKVGERCGVPVTLTDERAMSQEHNPFRTTESLTDYVTDLLMQGETSRAQ